MLAVAFTLARVCYCNDTKSHLNDNVLGGQNAAGVRLFGVDQFLPANVPLGASRGPIVR